MDAFCLYRSSHRRCSIKKDVFQNFTKFTGKHLCQSLFFDNVAGLKSVTLLKRGSDTDVFSCEFCEIFKNTFFTTSGRLLLFIWRLEIILLTTLLNKNKAYHHYIIHVRCVQYLLFRNYSLLNASRIFPLQHGWRFQT